jgi:hypothetical protein
MKRVVAAVAALIVLFCRSDTPVQTARKTTSNPSEKKASG